jgi:RNA polymerase sigma-70 factor, ECF subfamily
MRHESHNGEGIGYAEITFSELTLGHLARHMGTRGTGKSNSVAADSVRGQMRHIGLRPQVMMRLGPSSSEHDKSSPGFQDLAMPLFESLYNFAHWLTQNREDAEDLVQETYVKALKGFASFQLGTTFRAWMFQVLKNTFLSSRARLEMGITIPLRSEEVLPVLPTTSDTAESILVDRSRHDAVRSAIEQLPIIFREVILLCDVEEASYREIAETLSIPIVTVMSRLARARKAVRASLRSTPDATAEDKLALSRREPRKGY